MKLYVITHCETCYNRKGIFTGRVNSILTKHGHDHAKHLAEKLKNYQIDLAYTSPLTRNRQTLKHILKYHKKTPTIVDSRIIERDYGELARKSKNKYQQEHPDLYPVYHRSYRIAPPGGESMIQVEKRVLSFLDEVLTKMKTDNINVLIVAHKNSIRPILRHFMNLSPKEMMKLENLRHRIYTFNV